jgi:TonB family protein
VPVKGFRWMASATEPTPAGESEEAAAAVQEPLAAPIRLEWPRLRPTAWLRLAAFLAALAGHAAILLALTREPLDLRAGGYGHLMASVNVTIVDSTVLQARKLDVEQPLVPAAKDMVDAKDGVPDGKKSPQAAEDKQQPEKKAAQVQRPDAQVPAAEVIDKAEQMPEERRTKASDAKPIGGFSSRADTATTADQAAPAAASPGIVRAYAAAVAEALERTKPKRVPAYGTIRVKLVVSTDGELASVEILKSSGNRRLDDTIVAAVRRTKFPVPPPGLSLNERWYERTYMYVR